MERVKFEAGDWDAGLRIDMFISGRAEGRSRSAVQRLIEDGRVTLCGKPVKKSHTVSPGEVFEVIFPPAERTGIIPQRIPLDIVWEDGDIIVINKPRGMVVHPAPGHPDNTLVNALLCHSAGSLSGVGGALRPGIVHRLDKDTSGLIIAAKNDFAHMSLSEQLKDHSLSRVYEAVVCGKLSSDCGTVDAPIGRHRADRKRMAVTAKNSRAAVTHYRVITQYNGYAHVRCALETGRTHQIRVHMASIGHPVLGDPVYGRKKPEKGLSGQCLHAKELELTHPRSGERIKLETALPDYFLEILKKLTP